MLKCVLTHTEYIYTTILILMNFYHEMWIDIYISIDRWMEGTCAHRMHFTYMNVQTVEMGKFTLSFYSFSVGKMLKFTSTVHGLFACYGHFHKQFLSDHYRSSSASVLFISFLFHVKFHIQHSHTTETDHHHPPK